RGLGSRKMCRDLAEKAQRLRACYARSLHRAGQILPHLRDQLSPAERFGFGAQCLDLPELPSCHVHLLSSCNLSLGEIRHVRICYYFSNVPLPSLTNPLPDPPLPDSALLATPELRPALQC